MTELTQNVRRNMKTLMTFMILTFSYLSFAEDIDTYVLSSECVESVKIQKSKHGDYWDMIITLFNDESKKLNSFSQSHINEMVNIADGEGSVLVKVRVMGAISSPFYVSANSEEDALLTKESLLNNSGKCGNESTIN